MASDRRGRIATIAVAGAVLGALLLAAPGCSSGPERAASDSGHESHPTNTRDAGTEGTQAASGGSTPSDRPTTPVDEIVDVDGAGMRVRCTGSGTVTAVLIAGFETSSDIWSDVAPRAAEDTRVCSYDRLGTGESDPAPQSQTFDDQATDLYAALSSLGETGPYLVVGHSFGGPEAVTFASEHPDEVTGLLLVDASPATWPTTICAVPDDGSTAAASYQQLCSSISTPTGNVEHLDGIAAFEAVSKIDSLGDLPVVVMTATQHPWGLDDTENQRLDDAWEAGQDHWSSLSTSAHVVPVDDTGHNIQVDQPGAVVEQIRDLLR